MGTVVDGVEYTQRRGSLIFDTKKVGEGALNEIPPNRETATSQAIEEQRQKLGRRYASRTLFGGLAGGDAGMGLSGMSASTSLLGGF